MQTVTRAGARTSEFWLVLAFFGAVLLNGTAHFEIPTEQMTMLAAAAFGYAGGRTVLKNTLARSEGIGNGGKAS